VSDGLCDACGAPLPEERPTPRFTVYDRVFTVCSNPCDTALRGHLAEVVLVQHVLAVAEPEKKPASAPAKRAPRRTVAGANAKRGTSSAADPTAPTGPQRRS
jgi:hypothetical protein